MTIEEIKEYISRIETSATFDETGEWLNILIDGSQWKPIARQLREGILQCDFLFCLTCIDWKTHLTMVYHLTSTSDRQMNIVVRAKVSRENAEIDTVSDLWRTAEFHEREVFELFGVNFIGHPDMRKLILTDDFEGYPLRKDFEDPINMIRL